MILCLEKMIYHKQFYVVRREKYCFGCRKDTCMVEATQNSDTSNSSAVAKAVACKCLCFRAATFPTA